MELSKRLKAVASYVKQGAAVADVGTDHGYVPIYLVKNGIAARAVAMDVNEGPLVRAREHIRAYGLDGQIETRLGDGLSALKPGEADTAVIAGMGGPLIVRILTDGMETAKRLNRLILSPQSEIGQVRRFLAASGFGIADETMVEEDGKFYTVICAQPQGGYIEADGNGRTADWKDEKENGVQAYEWTYGKRLLEKKDPTLRRFLLKEQQKYTAVAHRLEHPQGEAQLARKREVEAELEQIRQALLELED